MTPVHTLTSTKFKTGIQRHLSAPTEPAATFLSNLEVMSGGEAPVSPSRPGREHGDGHTHTQAHVCDVVTSRLAPSSQTWARMSVSALVFLTGETVPGGRRT